MRVLTWIKYRGLQMCLDARNSTYGKGFPRFAERLFFTPSFNIPVMSGGAKHGHIIACWPSEYNSVVGLISPVKEVLSHFVLGCSWAETGLFDRIKRQLSQVKYVDGCRSMSDVYRRYENLDRLYDETAKIGRLRAQSEIQSLNIREFGGITLHIDAKGELVFSRVGQHRMAIALALGLSDVPFALGAVDAYIAKSFACIRNRYQPRGSLGTLK